MKNSRKQPFLNIYIYIFFNYYFFIKSIDLPHNLIQKNKNRMKNELSDFFLVKFPDLRKIIVIPIKNEIRKIKLKKSFFIRFLFILDQIVWKINGLDKKIIIKKKSKIKY